MALVLPVCTVGQDLFLAARNPLPPVPSFEMHETISSRQRNTSSVLALNSTFVDPFSAAVAFKVLMALVHGQATMHVHGVTANVFFEGVKEYTKEQVTVHFM